MLSVRFKHYRPNWNEMWSKCVASPFRVGVDSICKLHRIFHRMYRSWPRLGNFSITRQSGCGHANKSNRESSIVKLQRLMNIIFLYFHSSYIVKNKQTQLQTRSTLQVGATWLHLAWFQLKCLSTRHRSAVLSTFKETDSWEMGDRFSFYNAMLTNVPRAAK